MGQNHSSSFTSSLMRNSMLFDHLHQFLTALIHRPHATFCPALQNVFARKVDFIGCRRRFNQLAFRLYCTSLTHLLQFHICRIKTFLLSGCITGLARLAPAKACHAGAGTVGPAPCCLRRPRQKPRLNLQGEMSAVVEIGGVTGPSAWRAVHPLIFLPEQKGKAPYFLRSTVLFWWRIAGSNR